MVGESAGTRVTHSDLQYRETEADRMAPAVNAMRDIFHSLAEDDNELFLTELDLTHVGVPPKMLDYILQEIAVQYVRFFFRRAEKAAERSCLDKKFALLEGSHAAEDYMRLMEVDVDWDLCDRAGITEELKRLDAEMQDALHELARWRSSYETDKVCRIYHQARDLYAKAAQEQEQQPW